MNVIRFNIEVEFKKGKKEPWNPRAIRPYVISAFQGNVGDPDAYLAGIQQVWRQLEGENLRALFAPEDAVGMHTPEGLRCFLFNEEPPELANAERSTFIVLILCEVSDFNYVLRVFVKDLCRTLPRCKVRILEMHNPLLYLYNGENNDVFGADYKIRATFLRQTMPPYERLRAVGVLVVGLFFAALHLFGNSSAEAKGVYVNIYAACFVFLLTEFILRFLYNRVTGAQPQIVVTKDQAAGRIGPVAVGGGDDRRETVEIGEGLRCQLPG